MVKELQEIFQGALVREQGLDSLYRRILEVNGDQTEDDGFFLKALDDQNGDLELLSEIRRKYGNGEEPQNHEERGDVSRIPEQEESCRDTLIQKLIDLETELVELYKNSLRYLLSDDETRKLINRILTIKLTHKRDLMAKLKML